MVSSLIFSCFFSFIFVNALSFGVFPYLAIVLYLFPSIILSINQHLFFVSSLMVNLLSNLVILSSSCVLFYGNNFLVNYMVFIFGKLYMAPSLGSITRLRHGNRILGMAKYLIGLRIKTFEDEVTGMEVS